MASPSHVSLGMLITLSAVKPLRKGVTAEATVVHTC